MKFNNMRIWIIAALTGLLGYLGFVSFQRPDDNGDKERIILSAVMQIMEKNHFKETILHVFERIHDSWTFHFLKVWKTASDDNYDNQSYTKQ